MPRQLLGLTLFCLILSGCVFLDEDTRKTVTPPPALPTPPRPVQSEEITDQNARKMAQKLFDEMDFYEMKLSQEQAGKTK